MSTLAALVMSTLSLAGYLKEADGKKSTLYGKSEMYCGNVGYPKPCSRGARTASGAIFDPAVPSIALSLPRGFKLRPTLIWVKTLRSKCHAIFLTDKKAWKHAINHPWDVSVKAAELLKFRGTSDYLYLCKEGL